MRIALGAVFLSLVLSAEAQHFVRPAQPTSDDFIRYIITVGDTCGWQQSIVVNGSEITLTLVESGGCFAVVGVVVFDIGYLPAGSYNVTVNVDRGGDMYTETGSFVVAQGANTDIPTLHATTIALLLAALSIAGVLATRVTSG